MQNIINPLEAVQIECPICQTQTKAATVIDPINSIVRVKCYVCLAAWAYETVPAYQVEQPQVEIIRNKRLKREKLERMKDENISDEKRNIDG